MKVCIFTSYFGGPYQWGCDLAQELVANGVKVRHVHNFVERLMGLVSVKADVIHTTIPFPLKLWRKPVLLTIQGDFSIEKNILAKYYPKAIRQASALTTSSSYLKEKIPLPGATLIPNAVYPEKFRLAKHGTRQKLNLATVMNFYFEGKVKGIIDMLNILRDSGLSNFRHVIVGDGPYREQLEKYATDTKMDIIFTGTLQDVSLVLSNSDIFLYYTHQDSFPNVVAEAMASGLPVLTNNFGSMGDIINNGHDGLVAETPAQYTADLRNLFDSASYRRELGERARVSVEEKFNWHVIARKFIKLYEEISEYVNKKG